MKPIFDINSFLNHSLPISRETWMIVGAAAFLLLCLIIIGTVRSGRVKASQVFAEAGMVLIWTLGVYALSLVPWTPVYPVAIWCGTASVLFVVLLWIYLHRKKRSSDRVSSYAIRRSAAGSGAAKYARALLFGGLLVLSLLGVAGFYIDAPAFTVAAPLCVAVLALLLAGLTRWRFWYALGALVITVYAVLAVQQLLALKGFGMIIVLSALPTFLSVVLPMVTLSYIKQ